MANVLLTSAGMDFVLSASDNDNISIKVGYFVPVYDHRIDGSIRSSNMTSAFSAISDQSRTSPYGEIIWNILAGEYSLTDNDTCLISASTYSNGETSYTHSFQNNSRGVNLYDGVPLSNIISGTSVSLSGSDPYVWEISDGVGVVGENGRINGNASDFFTVTDYYPVRLSATNELRGNFRCVLQKNIGKFRFNKVALYAVALSNGSIIDGSETFFAEVYLDEPITKSGLAVDGFDSLVLDFQIDLHSIAADWDDVFYGTSGDYFDLVPNGLHSTEKISIGTFDSSQTPNSEPQATIHAGNHRTESNTWSAEPQLRLDYRNTDNKFEVEVTSATVGGTATMSVNDADILVFSATSAGEDVNADFASGALVRISADSDNRNAFVNGDVYRDDDSLIISSRILGNDTFTSKKYVGTTITGYLDIELASDSTTTTVGFYYIGNSTVGVYAPEEVAGVVTATFTKTLSDMSFNQAMAHVGERIQYALRNFIDTRSNATNNNNYGKHAFLNTKFYWDESLSKFVYESDPYDPCYIYYFYPTSTTIEGSLYNGTELTITTSASDVIFVGGSSAVSHNDSVRKLRHYDYDLIKDGSRVLLAAKKDIRLAGDVEFDNTNESISGGFMYAKGPKRTLNIMSGLREGFTSKNISASDIFPSRWDKMVYTGDSAGGFINIVAHQISMYAVSGDGVASGKIYFEGNLAPSRDNVYDIGNTSSWVKKIYSKNIDVNTLSATSLTATSLNTTNLTASSVSTNALTDLSLMTGDSLIVNNIHSYDGISTGPLASSIGLMKWYATSGTFGTLALNVNDVAYKSIYVTDIISGITWSGFAGINVLVSTEDQYGEKYYIPPNRTFSDASYTATPNSTYGIKLTIRFTFTGSYWNNKVPYYKLIIFYV